MFHWSEEYLLNGQVGKLNCAEFVEFLLNDRFKRKVQFPQTQSGGNIFGMTREIVENIPKFVGDKTNTPKDGDLVIMNAKRISTHVGVYIEIDGIGFVLHTFYRSRSVLRTRLKDLHQVGLELQGVYQWQEF